MRKHKGKWTRCLQLQIVLVLDKTLISYMHYLTPWKVSKSLVSCTV
jgi:hypothetical protein